MQIDYANGRFIASQVGDHLPDLQASRWTWNPKLKRWTTRLFKRAHPFREHAVGEARSRLYVDEASRKTSSDLLVPAPEGRTFRPFQLAGIEYALDRKDTLIADPCGLGKTVQAIGFCNWLTIRRVLLVVPASLKYKWLREWQRWTSHPHLTIGIVDTKNRQSKGKKWVEDVWPDTDIVICNPELLGRHLERIHMAPWDVLVIDEAHGLGSPDSQRTLHILGGSKGRGRRKQTWEPIPARRRLFLTATPMDKKPIRLWPLIRACDPDGLGANWYAFTRRYCAGKQLPFGYVTDGASNLDELNRHLRAVFMIRRDKLEVMKELPPKTRQLVELPDAGITTAIRRELSTIADQLAVFERLAGSKVNDPLDDRVIDELIRLEGAWQDQVASLTPAEKVAFEEISIVRRMVAEKKAPLVIDYVRRLLESEQKVVVLGFHTTLLKEIAAAFNSSVLVTGETPAERRDAHVEAFQHDPEVRVFVGNYVAAGVGIDLFAASHLVMAEASWVSWQCEQAEDRIWRMGQGMPCWIHYLVVRGSIEAHIVERFVEGELIAKTALD